MLGQGFFSEYFGSPCHRNSTNTSQPYSSSELLIGESQISEAWELPKRSGNDFEAVECKRKENKCTSIIGVGKRKSVLIDCKCLIGKHRII